MFYLHLLLLNGLHSSDLDELFVWDTQWSADSNHTFDHIHAHQDWVLVMEDMVLDDLDYTREHCIVGVGTFSFSDAFFYIVSELVE